MYVFTVHMYIHTDMCTDVNTYRRAESRRLDLQTTHVFVDRQTLVQTDKYTYEIETHGKTDAQAGTHAGKQTHVPRHTTTKTEHKHKNRHRNTKTDRHTQKKITHTH
jgi:hypothetical protein